MWNLEMLQAGNGPQKWAHTIGIHRVQHINNEGSLIELNYHLCHVVVLPWIRWHFLPDQSYCRISWSHSDIFVCLKPQTIIRFLDINHQMFRVPILRHVMHGHWIHFLGFKLEEPRRNLATRQPGYVHPFSPGRTEGELWGFPCFTGPCQSGTTVRKKSKAISWGHEHDWTCIFLCILI